MTRAGGPYCSVYQCTYKCSAKDRNFFRFPKDPERSKAWLIACKREDLLNKDPNLLYNSHRVCSQHFADKSFTSPFKNRLLPSAQPTIFHWSLKEFTMSRKEPEKTAAVEQRTATPEVYSFLNRTLSSNIVLIPEPIEENLIGSNALLGDVIEIEHTNSIRSGSEDDTNESRDEEDDVALLNLLKEFDLEVLFSNLKSAGITFRSLAYLKQRDIAEAIRPIGYRAEFREKLFAWRREERETENDVSKPSKVLDWLESNPKPDYVPPSPSSSVVAVNQLGLLTLLNKSERGQALIKQYKKNKVFTDEQRDELIGIIVADVIARNVSLNANDFSEIVKEITTVFPREAGEINFYFIPRRPKRNPEGKLYTTYYDAKSKRVKIEAVGENGAVQTSEALKLSEAANATIEAVREDLKSNTLSWFELCEKWKETFELRQLDRRKLSKSDFMQAWPKIKDPRAPHLINLDFQVLYPNKENLLKENWDAFKEKIKWYYNMKITSANAKDMLHVAKITKSSSQDYILMILLNSVLPSLGSVKMTNSMKRRKISVTEANEGFIIRILTLNDFQKELETVIYKYYGSITWEPFIVAQGRSLDLLKHFFVYFDKILYQFDSFIDCVDATFKIYKVFSLKYRKLSVLPWTFIQKYFYKIDTPNDIKSSHLTDLMNFMEQNLEVGPVSTGQ